MLSIASKKAKFCLINIILQVTDTRGHTLYKREQFGDLKGKFAFTADEYDIFEICLTNHAPAGKGYSLLLKKINRT